MNFLTEIADITKNLNLLIVEDDPDVRQLLLIILQPHFNKALEAENGLQGLDIFFNKSKIDLIVTDQDMPKLKGIDMIREIRRTNSEIPIIMITAFTASEILIDAINLGVNQFLLKPITIDTLFKSVSLALGDIIKRQKAIVEQENKILKVKEELNQLQKRLALSKQRALIRNDYYYKKLVLSDNDIWLINTKYLPYDIISGDSYSIRMVSDKKMLITLMDAVGKGLSAFVSSAIITTFLNYYIDENKDRFDFLQLIKSLHEYTLRQLSEDETFCIVLMLIDFSREVIEIVNFGMPPIIVVFSNNKYSLFSQDYLPISHKQEIEITNRVPLENIEKILIMSDGVYEPQNESKLIDDLLQAPYKTIFIEQILKYIDKHHDDMSVIFIRRFNPQPEWSKEFVIDSRIAMVHQLISDVEILMNELGFDVTFIVESTTAINEMLMNAYEHGSLAINHKEKNRLLKEDLYEERLLEIEKTVDKKIILQISCYNELHTNYFTFLIRDEGQGFDTKIIKDTIVDLDNFNFRGIKITKGLVDEIYYNSIGNEVMLIKRNIN